MTAGTNLLININRFSYQPDDAIGGAVLSGTVCYWNVAARLRPDRPTHAFQEQGLQTLKTFTAVVVPGTLEIQERDEIEVVFPRHSLYFGKRFRVIGVEASTMSTLDQRNYLVLRLSRDERAHGRQ